MLKKVAESEKKNLKIATLWILEASRTTSVWIECLDSCVCDVFSAYQLSDTTFHLPKRIEEKENLTSHWQKPQREEDTDSVTRHEAPRSCTCVLQRHLTAITDIIVVYWNTFLLPRSQSVSNKDVVVTEPTITFYWCQCRCIMSGPWK